MRRDKPFGALIGALGLAVMLAPADGVAQSRVQEATDKCVAQLERDYGAENPRVDRVNSRDSDNILVHVRVTLPGGQAEYMRCRIKRRGSDVRFVAVNRPGYDPGGVHENWAPADDLLIANRRVDETPDEAAPSAPSLAPATPKVVGAGRETVERTSGGRTGVGRIGASQGESSGASQGGSQGGSQGAAEGEGQDEGQDEGQSGPKTYSVQ